jgi:hypothetical protein
VTAWRSSKVTLYPLGDGGCETDFKRIIGAATISYFIEATLGQVNDIVYTAKLPG